MKKFMAIVLIVGLFLTMASGCNGEEKQASENVVKDSLVIGIDSDVSTLHPSDFSTGNEKNIIENIFEPLVYRPYENADQEPEPRIAESYTVSDDGLTYTFTLRKDIKFHNGDSLTAEDVKFSFELFQASPYQSQTVSGVKTIEATDDYTVVVTLENPNQFFLSNISLIGIVPKTYYESVGATEFAAKPIGSGPYKFVSKESGNKVVLEANSEYYRGEPSIKNVTFRIITDATTTSIAVETGEIDIAKIDAADYESLTKAENVKIQEVPTTTMCFVTMNLDREPFNNKLVRQAISYCIDRQSVIDMALEGFGTENSIIMSPMVFGYTEDVPKYEYDLEKAKSLLEQAGITTPYDLGKITISEVYSKQGQVLQNNLEELGFKCEIETLEFNTYLSTVMGGNFGISILGITFDPDPNMQAMLYCPEWLDGPNMSRYTDTEVTAWFEEAEKEVDNDVRAEMYKKILEKVQDEAAYASVYNPVDLYARNSSLNMEILLNGDFYLYNARWGK